MRRGFSPSSWCADGDTCCLQILANGLRVNVVALAKNDQRVAADWPLQLTNAHQSRWPVAGLELADRDGRCVSARLVSCRVEITELGIGELVGVEFEGVGVVGAEAFDELLRTEDAAPGSRRPQFEPPR